MMFPSLMINLSLLLLCITGHPQQSTKWFQLLIPGEPSTIPLKRLVSSIEVLTDLSRSQERNLLCSLNLDKLHPCCPVRFCIKAAICSTSTPVLAATVLQRPVQGSVSHLHLFIRLNGS